MKALHVEKGMVVFEVEGGQVGVAACGRERTDRQHEAAMLRLRADMIRRHIAKHGSALPLDGQILWMGIAERSEVLADALTLPSLAECRLAANQVRETA